MKKYKYAFLKSNNNSIGIAKGIMIFLSLLLLCKLLMGGFIKTGVGTAVIEFFGETLSGSSMPVYAYLNNIDRNSSSNVIHKMFYDLYPINEYVNASSSKVIGTNYEQHFDESHTQAVIKDYSENTAQTVSETQPSNESTTIEPSTAVTASVASDKFADVISNNVVTGTVYSRQNLDQYNFLYNNFYTVTSITKLGTDKLKPKEFLDKDMKITHNADTPQILIFHTHSQEDFVDSVKGDPSTTIVGVGDYLATLLREKYGFNVIHDTSVYDYVDGKLDRSKAYTYATEGIEKILAQNPSIDVVIDLHRDGVAEGTKLVTEINGKQTAKIMFFNGLSYTTMNGDISYLYNQYRDDNLAMSLQMQLLGNAYYPGLLRKIYVNAYRYCLHERGKSMLIEAGAQTNTLQEEKNAMEPLADMLAKLLNGEKVY